jgi:hypothetical protein
LWAEIEDIAQLMRKLIALKAKKHKEEALLAREARKLESLEAKRLAEAVPQPPPSNLAVAMAALAGAEEHRDDPEGERESGDGEDPGTPGSPPNP